MKNKPGQIILHITGCIAFLSLPVLLSPDVSMNFRFIKMPPFQKEFITYTLLLVFFYLNYFLFIPNFYFKQKLIFYTGCIVISYAIIASLPHIIIPGNHLLHSQQISQNETVHVIQPSDKHDGLSFAPPLPPNEGRPRDMDPLPGSNKDKGKQGYFNKGIPPDIQLPPANNRPPGMQHPPNRGPGFLWRIPNFEYLFQFIMVLVLSTLIRINNRLKQTEKEKVNAELSYLKAQINPHFLFNTLNSIYSSAIDESADNTASAVVKLSGMMRYVISEAHHDYVPLEKEMNYISDYIELQKIRLGSTVHLLYSVTGNAAGKQIAPLILISFIENAFKHGVNPEENSNIKIKIDIHDYNLHLSVLNNKVKTINGNDLKTNVGLDNTGSRLQLLYPSRHELTIKDDEKEFLVQLKINLQ